MDFKTILGAASLALATATVPAAAQDGGDPEAGEKVYNGAGLCRTCHMVGEDAKSMVGPPLNDLFGRQAGTHEGYKQYSSATKEAGEEGLVWNEETLYEYLKNPSDYIPGNRMGQMYPQGLQSKEDRENVIAYLKTFDDEPDNDDAENTYSPPE